MLTLERAAQKLAAFSFTFLNFHLVLFILFLGGGA